MRQKCYCIQSLIKVTMAKYMNEVKIGALHLSRKSMPGRGIGNMQRPEHVGLAGAMQ